MKSKLKTMAVKVLFWASDVLTGWAMYIGFGVTKQMLRDEVVRQRELKGPITP